MGDVKHLTLTNDDLVVINDALMQMPYYRVRPLVVKINEQLRAQVELDNGTVLSPTETKTVRDHA